MIRHRQGGTGRVERRVIILFSRVELMTIGLKVLVDNFNIQPITTPDQDLKVILG